MHALHEEVEFIAGGDGRCYALGVAGGLVVTKKVCFGLGKFGQRLRRRRIAWVCGTSIHTASCCIALFNNVVRISQFDAVLYCPPT